MCIRDRKKVGIITIVNVNNYGAELQAFATFRKLQLMGYNAEIINYLYYKDWRYIDSKMSRSFNSMSIKGKIIYFAKYRVASFVLNKILPLICKDVKQRIANFNSFHQHNTRFSKLYKSMKDLYTDTPIYDVYMVGSDQVWNPNASSSIEPYFLTFAPHSALTVSYASSFGVSKIENNSIANRIKLGLSSIKTISVRESSGVNLVKELTGRTAQLVCDPTLLLNKSEWTMFMKPVSNMPQRYVLIYQLSESDAIVKLATRIGKQEQIPVYRICKRAFKVKKDKGVVNILNAGPSEFLSLITNASFIITNSFHGTAFSINFDVPFYTVVSAKKKNNNRMESLLDYVGLGKRIVKDDVDITNLPIVGYDVNATQLKLKSFRLESEKFLEDALAYN